MRTSLRSVALRAAGIGAITGALLLAAAPVALADGAGSSQQPNAAGGWSVSTPAAGATFATDTDTPITIDCPQSDCSDPNGPVAVTVNDPRTSDSVCESISVDVAPSNGQLVSTDKLALAHPYGQSCGPLAGAPGYNGQWTVTAKDSTGTLASGTFTVKAPPAAPAAPSAVSGGSGVTVTWPTNPEPDTFAYGVTVDGKVVGTTVHCAFTDKTCTETVQVDPGQHQVAVIAARHTAPGSDDYIAGPSSAATAVTVAAPSASPTPSMHPTSGPHPTSSGTPSGAPLPSTVNLPSNNSRGLGGDFFNSNPLGALPSLGSGKGPKATSSPTLSAYQQYLLDEGPDGTYKNTLPYGTLDTQTTERIAQSSPSGGAFGGIASALGVSPVTAAACVSGGVLALLGALHLALWTRRTPIG